MASFFNEYHSQHFPESYDKHSTGSILIFKNF